MRMINNFGLPRVFARMGGTETPTKETETKPKKPTVPAEPAKRPDHEPFPGGEPAESPCRF